MSYLFDNNFSPRLAEMLALAGVDAKALRAVFPENILDVDYLPRLKDSGFILMTSDRHILTRSAEAIALRQSGITALFFKSFFIEMELRPQAAWLLNHWPKIEEFVERSHQGTIGLVPNRGQIKRYPL